MTEVPNIPVLRAGGELRDIPVGSIRAARRNPRTDAESTIDSLATSMGAGMVQVPIVIAVGDDAYELVDGERRWRASQAAGQATITCLVRDAAPPSALLFTQILANLHREDLGPLDESAALKAAWLVLNAQALGLAAEADAILERAERLRDALGPLRALLEGAGWNWHAPPVSQAVFVERLGLGMSAAVLKKKLQVLGANDSVQEAARQHRLTAAAIRSLMTLDTDQQAEVLAAIDADPSLARSVRTIVQGVRQKGRTVADAIAIVQGRLPDAVGDSVAFPTAHPAVGDEPGTAAADDGGDEPDQAPQTDAPTAPPALDEMAAMDAVLPLVELAQQINEHLATLRWLTGGDPSRIPEPWGDYVTDAIGLIRRSIATLHATA